MSRASTWTRGPATSAAMRTLFVSVVTVALVTTLSGRARADDAEWKARVSKTLSEVETGLAVLDKQPPTPGSLAERAAKLNARMLPLETAAGIEPGKISGRDTLSALSSDAASLNTRLQKLIAAGKPPGNPKPAAPPPPGPDAKPADPPAKDEPKKKDPKAWPQSLDFSIGARITYQETGSWLPFEVRPYVWEDRFRMDGYSAHVSFSLRTKGLLANIKSARVRVAIRVQGPLSNESDLYRVYEIDWVADNVMNNESKANWMNHDQFSVPAQERWVTPRKAQMTPQAYAHVLSVTLPDGTTKPFDAPTYRTR